MVKRIIVLLLLTASPAFGAVTELCGNGIDDVASSGGSANSGGFGSCGAGYTNSVAGTAGCDLLCPEPDKDGDGYRSDGVAGWAGVAATDCDDTNRRIYPGRQIATGCTGSDYKTCQTSGSYTACTTGPLAEGDTNKYIDCTSGNDANAGTYASPYKTLGKISGGASGTPASPYTLTQDDYVYLINSGACSTTFTDGNGRVLNASLTAAGASGHPITIKQYPGATATISSAAGPSIYLETTADWYRFIGLQLSSAHGANANGSTILNFGDHIIVDDVYITAMTGHGDNNDACLYNAHTTATTLTRNYLKDCKRDAGNADNIDAILILDDTGNGTECSDHVIKGNTVFYSTYDSTNNGNFYHYKHGCTLAEMGSSGLQFAYNTGTNYRIGLVVAGSGHRITRNRLYSDPIAQYVKIFQENGVKHTDNRIQYNSFLSGSGMFWNYPYYSSPESLLYDHNIHVDTDSSYAAGNNEGVISIDGYGSDGNKTSFESGSYLTSNSNGFYCPNATCVFSYYADSSGAGHGPSGAAGANYTFANWKGTVVQDVSSFVENPTLDSYYRATTANTLTFGWLLTSEEYTASESPGTTTGSGVTNLLRRRRR